MISERSGAFRNTRWLQNQARRAYAFRPQDLLDAATLSSSPVHIQHLQKLTSVGCLPTPVSVGPSWFNMVLGGAGSIAMGLVLAAKEAHLVYSVAVALVFSILIYFLFNRPRAVKPASPELPASPFKSSFARVSSTSSTSSSSSSFDVAKDPAARSITGSLSQLPDHVLHAVICQFSEPKDWESITETCYQFRTWIRENQQELMLAHLVQAPRIFQSLMQYNSFQEDIRGVYALPPSDQQAAGLLLAKRMSSMLDVIAQSQAYAVGFRSCFAPLLALDTDLFPVPQPPLPDVIEGIFGSQGETKEDPNTLLLRHTSAILLFIIVFDVQRTRAVNLTNDFAFWCRSVNANRRDRGAEEGSLSFEDINTMRAFVACQNPMFSAFESLVRKLSVKARTRFLERMISVISSCVSVLRTDPPFTVEFKDDPDLTNEKDPYLAVLVAALIFTDRIMHSLHTCPLPEGHTGHTNNDCRKGVLSLRDPRVNVGECVALVASQSSASVKDQLITLLTHAMRTPVAHMEEFLAVYAPN